MEWKTRIKWTVLLLCLKILIDKRPEILTCQVNELIDFLIKSVCSQAGKDTETPLVFQQLNDFMAYSGFWNCGEYFIFNKHNKRLISAYNSGFKESNAPF